VPTEPEQLFDEQTAPSPLRQHQRRLTDIEISELIEGYLAGSSVSQLTKTWKIHRTTVLDHLKRNNIPRRLNTRKLTDDQVEQAARRYRNGDSLSTLGEHYGVDPQTVSRELKAAGTIVRPSGRWNR
jgi:Helix-turn-helix domain